MLHQRVEKGLAAKEMEEKVRREGDSSSMERKFLCILKRKLKKKRTIADAAAQVTVGIYSIEKLSTRFEFRPAELHLNRR